MKEPLTSSDRCFPGVAGMPVIKSEVMKVRITRDLWQEGGIGRCWMFRSKWTGINTTGIWLRHPAASEGKENAVVPCVGNCPLAEASPVKNCNVTQYL